jgi:hypothetical protein
MYVIHFGLLHSDSTASIHSLFFDSIRSRCISRALSILVALGPALSPNFIGLAGSGRPGFDARVNLASQKVMT